jgi:hypothetical protein
MQPKARSWPANNFETDNISEQRHRVDPTGARPAKLDTSLQTNHDTTSGLPNSAFRFKFSRFRTEDLSSADSSLPQ